MTVRLTRQEFMERFDKRCSSMGPPFSSVLRVQAEIQPGATAENRMGTDFNVFLTEFFHKSLGVVLDRVYAEADR